MGSVGQSAETFVLPQKDISELRLESYAARSSSPLFSDKQPTYHRGLRTKFLMVWPLALHLVGSIAVAVILLYSLNGHQFYLERRPTVKLADGTYESRQLGQRHLLQSDITTILSILLMLLRWIAAAWAIPLCWRAIFVLAGKDGLRYHDINWVSNYGMLHPKTHFRQPLNLLLGLILILTLAPHPSAPLLTGSISWLPSNQTLDLRVPYHPTVKITGNPPNDTGFSFLLPYRATSSTNVIKNFNTAWSQVTEEFVFKRVVPSVAHLGIGSTIDSAALPYFTVTRIEWLPKLENEGSQLLNAMRLNQTQFPMLSDTMRQPGAAALIVNMTRFRDPSYRTMPSTWPILINVGRDISLEARGCDLNMTVLPSNTTIPVFYLDLNATDATDKALFGCFAYANVAYDAAFGLCTDCRISSYSTIQNDTELQLIRNNKIIQLVLRDMFKYIPSMTPLQDSLPDPAGSLEDYTTALLTRLYSALWNSWVDSAGYWPGLTSGYKPAVPMLKAEINPMRVYAWLFLQLLFTLAGLGFLWLQSRSHYPLITDTSMVAFDIDTTEISKRYLSSEDKDDKLLRVEPKGDGWKVVVVN